MSMFLFACVLVNFTVWYLQHELGGILEELTISFKDSLCKALENLKDRRHF